MVDFKDAILKELETRQGEAVMVRAVMERVLAPEVVERVFAVHRGRQYARRLMFSALVELLGLVVCRVWPSLHKAYLESGKAVGVSVKSLYNKVNGTTVALSEALVAESWQQLVPVVDELVVRPALVAGYRTRVVDGSHLAATDHRLAELRTVSGGPLPGVSVVVYDWERQLVVSMDSSEDAYTQERRLVLETVGRAEAGELWIADRNFCTSAVLTQLHHVGAAFVIRRHAQNVRFRRVGQEQPAGRTGTGKVFEQAVVIESEHGDEVAARLVRVVFDQPTRDGEREIELLTNLPASVSAAEVAEAYRRRWDIEVAFADLRQLFSGEIESLGHPRAALLAFSLSLVAYNALSAVRAALGKVHGAEKVAAEVSSYQMAIRIQRAWEATELWGSDPEWTARFASLTPAALAAYLCRVASSVDLERLIKKPRGPKKPRPQRRGTKPHVSTARILSKRQ